MTMQLDPAKPGVDIGIVISDSEKSLAFYRDTLGLEHLADMAMPVGGGGTMHRMGCGGTTLKLVKWNTVPAAANPPGGLHTAVGIRYLTIWVKNLVEITAACETAGYKIAVQPSEIRKGISISMVEDPDGNWVELLEAS
jgi:catechol 2,3-dioxygenase-like lactoylglutathione lyase family enzyme